MAFYMDDTNIDSLEDPTKYDWRGAAIKLDDVINFFTKNPGTYEFEYKEEWNTADDEDEGDIMLKKK